MISLIGESTAVARFGLCSRLWQMTNSWDLLRSPGVAKAIFIQGQIMILAFSYGAILSLFCFTTMRLSGFDFPPKKINFFLLVIGVAQASWLLLIFLRLQRRLGTVSIMRGCAYIYPLFFATFPLLDTILKFGHRAEIWTIASIVAAVFSGVAMSFTAA